jgi:hypothetical protein
MAYDPRNWYWRASDGRVFSSRRGAIVPANDADFAAWKAAGNQPTPWPRDDVGTESGAALRQVLALHGVAGPSGAPSAVEARAECAKRILAYASDATQLNMLAYGLALIAKPSRTAEDQADLAAFAQGATWIGAMRAKWRALVTAGDPDWRDDAKWPACPQAAADLAAKL